MSDNMPPSPLQYHGVSASQGQQDTLGVEDLNAHEGGAGEGWPQHQDMGIRCQLRARQMKIHQNCVVDKGKR